MAEVRSGGTYRVEPDFAARQSILWAIAWLVGAGALTVVLYALLLVPGITNAIPLLSYGRLHAVADTTLWFGWLATAGFAAAYAIVPRIGEVQLQNEVLGAATTLTWSVLLTGGIVAIVLGRFNQGRLLAELPAGVDLGVLLMLVFVLYNVAATVVRRREKTLYVSGWYLLAAALLAPIVYVVGNLPVFRGVTDVIASGFYQNGLMMLWFLPVGLAVAYYVVPVETGNALYSGSLARAGFWSLMFAGGWTGQRLFLNGPGPAYLESIAVAMTFVLLVPVLSSVANLYATARGRWGAVADMFALRFAVTGLGLAAVWMVLTAFYSVPLMSKYFGLTSYATALRYLAGFGVFSSLAFAFIYHAYPLMVGRDWWSRPLATAHFWTSVGGAVLATGGLFGAGAAQVGTLAGTTAAGLAQAMKTGAGLQRMFEIEVVAGAAIFAAGQLLFAFNTYRTSRAGPLVTHVPARPMVASPV
jgi:cytochrome c oxidase cbb3-type subunit 1